MRFVTLNPNSLNLLLSENKVQYRQMLDPIVKQGGMTADEADSVATTVRKSLKRNDRIVWWLLKYRMHKTWIIYSNLNQKISANKELDPGTKAQQRKPITDWFVKINKINPDSPDANSYSRQHFYSNFSLDSETFKHTVSMLDISPEIANVVWDPKDDSFGLEIKLNKAETEWKAAKQQVLKAKPEDKIIIDYGKTAWMILPRAYCDDEADAMGHCGNSASYRTGERILSYRTKETEDGSWRPHLTFILDKDGNLGEMKGRNNNKPDAKYYDVITDLLLNPLVKGIKGGGYNPENNFDIWNLSTKQLLSLFDKKPELIPPPPADGWSDSRVRIPPEMQQLLVSQDPDWLFKIKNLKLDLRKQRSAMTYAIVDEPGLTDLHYGQRLTRDAYQQALDDNGEDTFTVVKRK